MTEFFRSFFSTNIWINTISIIGVFFAVYLSILTNKQLLRGNKNVIIPAIFVILVTLYIGTRPITCYCDTFLYTLGYDLIKSGIWLQSPYEEVEPFFAAIEMICIPITDASGWLLVITSFYVIGATIAVSRWLPAHLMIILLFIFTAFSFWAYGTNTIRQGMATSIALIGLSCFCRNKFQFILGGIILIIAALTHKSTLLILTAATIALFLKNTKINISIWIISVILGILFSDFFKSHLSELIDDHRMTQYSSMDTERTAYNIGLRWDFILYSSMPIILGQFLILKKKINDKIYTFLLHTYIFANSFWALINSIAFSDRYAYLSWFLYPILIAYPFCKFKICKGQSAILALFLIGSIIFNYLMYS